MDLETVLAEVRSWPVEDRIRLMEEIREGLADEECEPELTDELKDLLDRRLAALDADPENVTTWEAIKEHVRRPR
jgi:putative addiction module component (TIGR02574 family)